MNGKQCQGCLPLLETTLACSVHQCTLYLTPGHLQHARAAKCPKYLDSQEYFILAGSGWTDLPCFQHISTEQPLLLPPFLNSTFGPVTNALFFSPLENFNYAQMHKIFHQFCFLFIYYLKISCVCPPCAYDSYLRNLLYTKNQDMLYEHVGHSELPSGQCCLCYNGQLHSDILVPGFQQRRSKGNKFRYR